MTPSEFVYEIYKSHDFKLEFMIYTLIYDCDLWFHFGLNIDKIQG